MVCDQYQEEKNTFFLSRKIGPYEVGRWSNIFYLPGTWYGVRLP